MLPGIDGIEVCRRLREHGDVPVIMLTALGEETDRVVGLEVGADDYVTKPFSPRELALRVDSVLRRVDAPAAPRRLVDGDLVVDEARHAAYRGGEPLALTGREFDLLRFLLAHPGTAYSRDELLEQVWGWSFGDQSTVTVHVRRLRGEDRARPDPARPAADRVGRRLPVGGRRVSSDQLQILLVAGGVRGRGGPCRPGAWRGRSATGRSSGSSRWSWSVAIGSVLAGVVAIARLMFISSHDRDVVTLVSVASGAVALLVAVAVGAAHRALVGGAARGRPPAGRARVVRRRARAARASCRRSRPSWRAPAGGWRSPGSARHGWRPRGASWSRGSPTTCARRWPGCGR